MQNHIFIYGTLLPGLRLHRYMLGALSCGAAEVRAHLYDVGGYPGLVTSASDDAARVKGEVYAIDDAHLARLDELEGVVPGNDAMSHYLRQRISLIQFNKGHPSDVWTYLFNRSLEGRTRILSGDYQSYLGFRSASPAE